MTEADFKRELGKAQTMQRIEADPMKAAYWRGFQKGIRRNFHGPNFGTAEEHARMMEAQNSPDDERREIGRGYRDGITHNGKETRQ